MLDLCNLVIQSTSLSKLSESQTDSSTTNYDPSTNIDWKTYLDDDNDDQVNDYLDNDAEVLFMILYKINVAIILPSSSTLAYVKEEIDERLKLDHGSTCWSTKLMTENG